MQEKLATLSCNRLSGNNDDDETSDVVTDDERLTPEGQERMTNISPSTSRLE